MKNEKYQELRSCQTIKMIRRRLQNIEKKLNITGWGKRDRVDEGSGKIKIDLDIPTSLQKLREKIIMDFRKERSDEGYSLSFNTNDLHMPQDWWEQFDSIIARCLEEIEKGESK